MKLRSVQTTAGRGGTRVADQPLRVLHLIGTAEPGGVETFVLNLAMAIKRDRVRLMACILGEDGPIAEELRALEVPVRLLGRRSSIRRFSALYREIASSNCDIVHANVGGRALWYAMRAAGCRHLISHLHGPPRDVPAGDARATSYATRAVAGAEQIVVSSDAMIRWIATAKPELLVRTQRIYYGIDEQRFLSPAAAGGDIRMRAALGIDESQVVVGFVGRLVPQKGIRHLAAIAREVLQQRPNVHLIVAGDGELRSLLAEIETTFERRVHILGARRDISAIMRLVDILIVPSEWEPLGIVNIEAMLSSRPVIAFDVDGISEVVQHESTGLLAPARDTTTFVTHVLRLADDALLRERMGNAGRARAREHFSAQKMAREFEQLYARVRA